MLEKLLRSLAVQETKGLFDYSVVVVDNDAAGYGKNTIMNLKDELSIDLTYAIEPERSIPAVRNHALRLSRGNYIGIIDDDEFAPDNWLATMYQAIHKYGADGVLGPVLPFFENEPPEWLIKGRFCERPTLPTGTLLQWSQTRTGNVLLKKDVFEKHHICFDTRFKTGGSDQEFFRQAIMRGCNFIAVEEAPVYEIVPPSRWEKRYWLKRAIVNGYNSHRYSLSNTKKATRIYSYFKSAGALLVYSAAAPFCAILGTHTLISCLERGCHHFSRLLAIIGIELLKKRDF